MPSQDESDEPNSATFTIIFNDVEYVDVDAGATADGGFTCLLCTPHAGVTGLDALTASVKGDQEK